MGRERTSDREPAPAGIPVVEATDGATISPDVAPKNPRSGLDGGGAADPDGVESTEGDRVHELELENLRLRRIVADRDLEIEMLRELSRGTY